MSKNGYARLRARKLYFPKRPVSPRRRALCLAALGFLAAGLACSDSAAPADVGSIAGAEDPGAASPVVLFLGTSLTAGYGLPADEAFPAHVQREIDAAGLDFRVVNAGVSGDTSAGGLARLDWLLRLPIAVLVLELGANEMLRGQDVDALRANLQQILDRTREVHPRARFVIAGMQAAPNLGADYTARYNRVFGELAEHNDAALIPFLLEGVAGEAELNQTDGIHPTAEGQRIVAESVWRELSPVLRASVEKERSR